MTMWLYFEVGHMHNLPNNDRVDLKSLSLPTKNPGVHSIVSNLTHTQTDYSYFLEMSCAMIIKSGHIG